MMLPRLRPLIQEQLLCDQNRSIMQGVTRHVFTLRADMARLRRFIDSYLNFVDDDMPPPFYFQPVAPFVTFELLYYQYLSVASRNLISYPQREMSFSIPIECYAIEDGVLVFKQYAVCIPFLYVDEELSVISGRDLFGLPKVALKFNDLIDQVRPDSPAQIGRLTLRVPGGPDGDTYAPFIEVYRDPPRYVSVRQTPANLINALPDAIRGYSAFAADMWEALARPPIRGYDNQRDLQSMLGMLRANADMLTAGFPIFPFMRQAPQFAQSSADEQFGPMFADLITLKQARDAEDPQLVSYQALVKSTMYLDRINDGGFLFGPLASDPSSDITIKIHRLQGQPVVESLGLVTEDTSSGGGAGRAVGAGGRGDYSRESTQMVSTLKPVFPFWLNVDLAYGLGTNLYWRGRNTQWSSTDDPGPPSDGNRYLTFGSGALAEEACSIVSPDSLIWVLELPLDVDNDAIPRLNHLCSEYLKNDCYEFRLAMDRPSVWMFIRNMDNTGEGRGPDIEQEVEFAAVVEWFDKRNGNAGGPPLGYALMPLYVLTDNQTAVFTESEVFGRPTVEARIDFDSDNWTTMPPSSVMTVKTLLMPELYSGGAPAWRSIVQVQVTFPGFSGRKVSREEANKLPLPFPSVALKQIVDCRLPDRVDFQAIVFRVLRIDPLDETEIEKFKKIEERNTRAAHHHREQIEALKAEVAMLKQRIPPPGSPVQQLVAAIGEASLAAFDQASPECLDPKQWSVTISRYGSLPLVHKMGLKVAGRTAGEYTTDEIIEPCNVWALPASIEELGAVNLAWRLGNSLWMSHRDPLAELEKIAPGITKFGQGLPMTTFVDYLTNVAVLSSI